MPRFAPVFRLAGRLHVVQTTPEAARMDFFNTLGPYSDTYCKSLRRRLRSATLLAGFAEDPGYRDRLDLPSRSAPEPTVAARRLRGRRGYEGRRSESGNQSKSGHP